MTARRRLLDLFCGAGGAAMGYHRAGFDVVGVDIEPQPHYPFRCLEYNAMDVLNALVLGDCFSWLRVDDFDAIHASPPCQDHSMMLNFGQAPHGTGWMLAATRERLQAIGLPWVIENVPGAPMRADYKLCGCMFDLPRIKRERWFETSWQGFDLRSPCYHDQPAIPIAGRGVTSWYRHRYGSVHIADRRAAMGINWPMTREGLAQAIPPAYTEYIGQQLLDALKPAA